MVKGISSCKWLIILILFTMCSGLEQSKKEEIRRNNEVEEFIYRHHDEKHFSWIDHKPRTRETYPWEEEYIGHLPRITKEYFRCKGKSDNPEKVRKDKNNNPIYYHDCSGIERHSLPVKNGKEFIYPILIDLLNYIQLKTEKRVVITCGHRCPVHDLYVKGGSVTKPSKHLVGAQVDFYVEGLEKKPKEILKWVKEYFLESQKYQNEVEYTRFIEEKSGKSIQNKEILAQIFEEDENRDFDNRHSYPYITLEVKYDFEENKRVFYSWEKAFNGYLRW